jgi:hypothetical protein
MHEAQRYRCNAIECLLTATEASQPLVPPTSSFHGLVHRDHLRAVEVSAASAGFAKRKARNLVATRALLMTP